MKNDLSGAEEELSFGEWLREARADKNMSLRSLATRLQITPAYLSDIENDHRTPAEEVIQKLAAELSIDFDELMVRARRFGKDAEEYIQRQPEAVRLLRRVSEANLDADQLRNLTAKMKEGDAK